MNPAHQRRRTLAVCGILSVLTLAAFWSVPFKGFISYDDPIYVTGNAHVQQGLTAESFRWAFGGLQAGFWHPLTWVSLMLDAQLYGANPMGFHVTSLLFHLANTLLLFGLFKRMTGDPWPSAFVAALFAVHPLHVESVVWVAERKDVLSTFFFLLTLHAYVQYAALVTVNSRSSTLNPSASAFGSGATASKRSEDGQPSTTSHSVLRTPHSALAKHGPPSTVFWYLLTMVLFSMGLMSKTMVVTLPGVMLLLDWWPLCRVSFSPATLNPSASALGSGEIALKRSEDGQPSTTPPLRLILEKLPFAGLAVGCILVTVQAQERIGAVSFSTAPPLTHRLANALQAYVAYVGKTIWPSDLAVFYAYPHQFPLPQVVGALGLLLIVTGLVIAFQRQPYLAVGWFWFVGTLVPVIGLIHFGLQSMADRYSYIPLIGLFVAVAWLGADVVLRQPAVRPGLWMAGTLAVAACVVMTWVQVSYWRNTRTLFEHAVAVTRNNAVAHNDLGVCLLEAGELAGAEAHFAEAMRLEPAYATAVINLGNCRQKQGRLAEAIELQQKALRIEDSAMAHYNLACLLLEKPDLLAAESQLQSAVRLDPEYVDAWYNLGVLESKRRQWPEAARAMLKVLEFQPGLLRAHLRLGTALVEQLRWDEAIEHLTKGVGAFPGDATGHFDLGRAKAGKKDFAGAAACFAQALALDPQNTEARKQLGLALVAIGNMADAVPHLQAAVEKAPDGPTHYNLALALHGLGRFKEALDHYREATRFEPDNAEYGNDFAWLLATSPQPQYRNGAEAVRLAERVCRLNGQEPRFWGTLDASYAEAGRWDVAVATASKTHDLAMAKGEPEVAKAAEERLAFYRKRQAYHSAN